MVAIIGAFGACFVSLLFERLSLPYHFCAVLLRFAWGGPPEGTGADLRRPFWSHCSYALRSHSRGEPFARR